MSDCKCYTESKCPLHDLLDDDGNYFPGCEPVTDAIRETVVENIKRDRELSGLLTVKNWVYWPEGRYSITPTHVGEVFVTYNQAGHGAIYGFDMQGNVFCYMD